MSAVIQLGATAIIIWPFASATRVLWIQRRQPIRRDSPVTGPWIAPRSWRQ